MVDDIDISSETLIEHQTSPMILNAICEEFNDLLKDCIILNIKAPKDFYAESVILEIDRMNQSLNQLSASKYDWIDVYIDAMKDFDKSSVLFTKQMDLQHSIESVIFHH